MSRYCKCGRELAAWQSGCLRHPNCKPPEQPPAHLNEAAISLARVLPTDDSVDPRMPEGTTKPLLRTEQPHEVPLCKHGYALHCDACAHAGRMVDELRVGMRGKQAVINELRAKLAEAEKGRTELIIKQGESLVRESGHLEREQWERARADLAEKRAEAAEARVKELEREMANGKDALLESLRNKP